MTKNFGVQNRSEATAFEGAEAVASGSRSAPVLNPSNVLVTNPVPAVSVSVGGSPGI